MTKNPSSLRKAASVAGIYNQYNGQQSPPISTEERLQRLAAEDMNMSAHKASEHKWDTSSRRMEQIFEHEFQPTATARILERATSHASRPAEFSARDDLLRKLSILQQSFAGSSESRRHSLYSEPCIVRSSSVKGPPRPPKEPIPEPEKSLLPEDFAKPFCEFLTNNPTVYHAVAAVGKELEQNGYKKLSERDSWDLKKGGKYYTERNGSGLIAFAVGEKYEPGNGTAILAGHIDALATRLKPVSNLRTKAGYVQLGVAPYAGALNSTWWDRDLGIGGRVIVKESSGKIVSKLVKLDWPIARVPTLAPHFGAVAGAPFNKETQMVPIIGLDNSDLSGQSQEEAFKPAVLGGAGSFTATQPPRLVKAITNELAVTDYSSIINWDLELFDIQPATLGGIDKEFIFAGRIDDKLCSWAAYQALINSTKDMSTSGQIKVVGLFDDEEIGSLLRQGARGNFLPSVLTRAVDAFAPNGSASASLMSQTFANSFLVSSDVTHAVNPNFLQAYEPNHSPRLNIGLTVCGDSNGHMTTDAISTSILQRCAEKCGQKLQVFQIRNDVRSGGTVGPMLSAMTGIRAIDAGLPQLSMHSIRATTGSKDPGLGVFAFQGFLDHFEEVDREFRE